MLVRATVAVFLICCLVVTIVFGLMYTAVELAKDYKPEVDGVLVTKPADGKPAKEISVGSTAKEMSFSDFMAWQRGMGGDGTGQEKEGGRGRSWVGGFKMGRPLNQNDCCACFLCLIIFACYSAKSLWLYNMARQRALF